MTPPVVERLRRVSLELPESLIERIERQCEYTNMSRNAFLIAAIEGLVREFEQIDDECGVACPRCGAITDVDELTDGRHRVCVRCPWRRRL